MLFSLLFSRNDDTVFDFLVVGWWSEGIADGRASGSRARIE